MKHYLITEELRDRIAFYVNTDELLALPEAHPLDLAKLERYSVENCRDGKDVFPSESGEFFLISDLLGAVQPDAKVLVEAVQNMIDHWDTPFWVAGETTSHYIEVLRAALSAYRGGAK